MLTCAILAVAQMGELLAPTFALANHSCVPSCAVDIRDGAIVLVALQNISSNEEVKSILK